MLYWKKDKIQGIDNLEKRERKVITFPMAAVFMAMMIGILTGLGSGYCIWGREPENTIDLKAVEMPDWVQQDFLRKNIFSREPVQRLPETILTVWQTRMHRKRGFLPAVIL